MNNQQKAHKYCLQHFYLAGVVRRSSIENALINMAQWKDEMVKRKLRDIIEVVENGLERGDPEGVIINELKELLKIEQ